MQKFVNNKSSYTASYTHSLPSLQPPRQMTAANPVVTIVLDAIKTTTPPHVVSSQRLSQPTRNTNEFSTLSAKILCRSQSTVTPFWFLPVLSYVSILRLARQTKTPTAPDPTRTELHGRRGGRNKGRPAVASIASDDTSADTYVADDTSADTYVADYDADNNVRLLRSWG